MRMLILGLTNPTNQPFARELWVTDPAALLARFIAPLLIVIGSRIFRSTSRPMAPCLRR
jgi:hypothetical protein